MFLPSVSSIGNQKERKDNVIYDLVFKAFLNTYNIQT